MNLILDTYCVIKNDKVFVDGTEYYTGTQFEGDFLKGLYKNLEIDYPKFYKMDNLSKLGFLGVEILNKFDNTLADLQDDAIAMVFQSEKGCLESDIKHQSEVNRKSPSPAVFVYTLSNIVIGEISIRNKWFGESIFFIDKTSNLTNLINYSKSLILTEKAEVCLVGIIESFESTHNLNLGVVRKGDRGTAFNKENLCTIFKI